MASLNECHFIGNLTADPESKSVGANGQLATFSICVSKRIRDIKEPSGYRENKMFLLIEVWGDQSKNIMQYLKKGSLVFVAGELHYDTWTASDKTPRSRHKLVAGNIQFL